MKALFVAFTCALLSSLVASKKAALKPLHTQPLATDRQEESIDQPKIESFGLVRYKEDKKDEAQAGDEANTADWCQGNVFPEPNKTFHIGHSTNVGVFDTQTLTELHQALNDDNDWAFDRVWEFKAKVTSAFANEMPFGMPGGNGFLEFTVPAAASSAIVTAKGNVQADADSVEIVYRGPSQNDLLEDKITFSQVCLRQQPCAQFTGCLPTEKYEVKLSSNGDNMDDCCTKIYCKDNVNCTPSSMWGEFEDSATTRLGNTLELCCSPKFCTDAAEAVCINGSKLKAGDGLLGSTELECCEASFCRDFTGCPDTMLPPEMEDGSPRRGESKWECCMEVQCDTFNCGASDLWTLKEGASNITGHNILDCCDMLYCANHTCEASTKYTLKKPPPLQGSTDERCCYPVYCDSYNCSSGKVAMPSSATRRGSTDAECCEDALCMHYDCSDASKWRKKSDHVQSDGIESPRKGGTDEDCCTPEYCRKFKCTSTMWKDRVWADDDETLGWTHELCCDKVFCGNLTCTTDWDGDGIGSKWYKRKDTNTKKWQGSTDEECCYPIYCSQYHTKFPTKWKRKNTPAGGSPLLGSTESECFDPMFCSTFYSCDVTKGQQIIVDAGTIQGSTEDECCENMTTTTEALGLVGLVRKWTR